MEGLPKTAFADKRLCPLFQKGIAVVSGHGSWDFKVFTESIVLQINITFEVEKLFQICNN